MSAILQSLCSSLACVSRCSGPEDEDPADRTMRRVNDLGLVSMEAVGLTCAAMSHASGPVCFAAIPCIAVPLLVAGVEWLFCPTLLCGWKREEPSTKEATESLVQDLGEYARQGRVHALVHGRHL
jgi:hypothetical protein